MIDETFLVSTLTDIVQINSVNPELDPQGPGEEELGNYISNLLDSLHIQSAIKQVGANRVNVIGTLEGNGSGKSLMFNAHMDTVGTVGMENPFSAVSENGRLYGRGSYDMKGSIAAILTMAKAIKEQNIELAGDIILAFVADEEFESVGTQHLLRDYKTNAAIVAEPTNLDICLAHRGFGVYEISTAGKAAHGGNEQEGIDANIKMGLLLAELDKYSKKILKKRKHFLLGQPSLHVPVIHGGQSLFIYSKECTIKLERRTLPGETQGNITRELEGLIHNLSSWDKNFKASIQPLIWREAYEISNRAPIVQTLFQSTINVIGHQPAYIAHPWWEDSGLIGNSGIETVIMGPKGDGIHQQIEWVDIKSVVDLSNIFLQTAISYCFDN